MCKARTCSQKRASSPFTKRRFASSNVTEGWNGNTVLYFHSAISPTGQVRENGTACFGGGSFISPPPRPMTIPALRKSGWPRSDLSSGVPGNAASLQVQPKERVPREGTSRRSTLEQTLWISLCGWKQSRSGQQTLVPSPLAPQVPCQLSRGEEPPFFKRCWDTPGSSPSQTAPCYNNAATKLLAMLWKHKSKIGAGKTCPAALREKGAHCKRGGTRSQ